jgi:hypothetical protein
MNDINAQLTKIANLMQEQSVIGSEIYNLVNKSEDVYFDKVVYSIPTQKNPFIAIRDNKTKDWVTTDDCRWIFKRPSESPDRYMILMIPVGLINLETKAVVLFNLGDNKHKDSEDITRVVPFFSGFYIYKNEKENTYPQFDINLGMNGHVWNLYKEDSAFTYEKVAPSNSGQLKEIEIESSPHNEKKVIGYYPYRVGEIEPFEFYQAY